MRLLNSPRPICLSVVFVTITFLNNSLVGQTLVVSLDTPGQPAGGAASPFLGQSITTPGIGQFSNVTFNLFANTIKNNTFVQGNPYAEGSLFLLTEQFSGPANQLSSSTSGFLASTANVVPDGAGFEWAFAADLVLEPSTEYFFYSATPQTSPFGISFSTGADSFSGGNLFSASTDGGFSPDFAADHHFQLAGTAIPEPSSLFVIVVAAGLHALRRKRITTLG